MESRIATASAPRRARALGVAASAGPSFAVQGPVLRRGVRVLGRPLAWAPVAEPPAGAPVAWWRVVARAAATFAVVVVAGLAVLATAPGALGYRPVVVASGSMEPSIRVGDVVVTAPSSGRHLRPGTVVDFATRDGSRIHRVAQVVPGGYRTRGDANGRDDTDLVRPSQIRGVGILVVPFVGGLSLWVGRGMWLPLLLLSAGLVAALHVSRRRWAVPWRHRG